jgi:hypothetical protein
MLINLKNTETIEKIETECNICFEKIKKEDKVKKLKCNHKYHLECIQIWKNTMKLESNIYIHRYNCPYCRM